MQGLNPETELKIGSCCSYLLRFQRPTSPLLVMDYIEWTKEEDGLEFQTQAPAFVLKIKIILFAEGGGVLWR